MKRHGNLWKQIIDLDNITLAYKKARKAKSWQRTIKEFEKNEKAYLKRIHRQLAEKTFTTSEYRIKKVYEPKERDIYILPFDPDRIVQHALVNVLGPIWDNLMIKDSYACRPGKGQHRASYAVMRAVRKQKYCFQADIQKFYPSIRHDLLMQVLAKKVKDKDVLWLLEDIIYSIPGGRNVPIGNFTSQWFGNLYLNELDYYIKHTLKHKYYLRYNDDFIIIDSNKEKLQDSKKSIRSFLKDNLNLILSKEQVRHISKGVTFVGYRHFINKILIRKSTVKRLKKRLKNLTNKVDKGIQIRNMSSIIGAIEGWLKHANTFNLKTKYNFFYLKETINNERIS